MLTLAFCLFGRRGGLKLALLLMVLTLTGCVTGLERAEFTPLARPESRTNAAINFARTLKTRRNSRPEALPLHRPIDSPPRAVPNAPGFSPSLADCDAADSTFAAAAGPANSWEPGCGWRVNPHAPASASAASWLAAGRPSGGSTRRWSGHV